MHDGRKLEDYLDAIRRSGYLFESRLVSTLNDARFNVDPNQPFKDPQTGKSREIDIVAEDIPQGKPLLRKVGVRTNFVIEASNNLFPVVLLTPKEISLNSNMSPYKYWISPYDEPFCGAGVDYEMEDYDRNSNIGVYLQYCTFQEKKTKGRELMAYHSEKLFSYLTKLKDYCIVQINERYERRLQNDYWVVHYYRPLLVLQNELFILDSKSGNEVDLVAVDHARLEFSYHSNQSVLSDEGPDSIMIDIITERALLPFMRETCNKDDEMRRKIFEFRQKVESEEEKPS